MSSSARRDSTRWRPSRPSSSPPTQPSRVEPVTRRTKRHITRIISEPTTAAAIRQPNGSIPNAFSPSAISHFPTSGCTVIDGVSCQRPWSVRKDQLVGVLHVIARVAVVEQRPRVLGVVGLVEAEGLRLAEVPEPEEEAEQRDADRPAPADERVLEVEAAVGRVVASGSTSPDDVRERLTRRVRPVGGVSRVALTTGTLRSGPRESTRSIVAPQEMPRSTCSLRSEDDRGWRTTRACWSWRGRRSAAPRTRRRGSPTSSRAPTSWRPRTPAACAGCAPTSSITIGGRVVSYFEGNEERVRRPWSTRCSRGSGSSW